MTSQEGISQFRKSLNKALSKQLSNPSKSQIASDAIFTEAKMEYL